MTRTLRIFENTPNTAIDTRRTANAVASLSVKGALKQWYVLNHIIMQEIAIKFGIQTTSIKLFRRLKFNAANVTPEAEFAPKVYF